MDEAIEVVESEIREHLAYVKKRYAAEVVTGPSRNRLEGNIGALEFVLRIINDVRTAPVERHFLNCVCADCSGAVMDARND